MSHLEPRSSHDAPGNRGEAGLGGSASRLGAQQDWAITELGARKAAGTARGPWSQPGLRSDGTPGAPRGSSPAGEPGAGVCAAGDQQEAGLQPTPETYLPPRQASATGCALDALPAGPSLLPEAAPRDLRRAAICQPSPRAPVRRVWEEPATPWRDRGTRPGARAAGRERGSLGVTHLGPRLGRGGSSDT